MTLARYRRSSCLQLDENARLRDDLAQKEDKIEQLDEDKKQIGAQAAEKVKQALYSYVSSLINMPDLMLLQGWKQFRRRTLT